MRSGDIAQSVLSPAGAQSSSIHQLWSLMLWTTTIVGLATGTAAYVVTVVRQGWVNQTVREQRYLAERIAGELARGTMKHGSISSTARA